MIDNKSLHLLELLQIVDEVEPKKAGKLRQLNRQTKPSQQLHQYLTKNIQFQKLFQSKALKRRHNDREIGVLSVHYP